MTNCICCRCGTDITSFDITDHNQIFGFTILNRFLVCDQSRDTKLLIHGDLWFHCRDQIKGRIHDSFVILPDCFCSALQSLPKLCKSLFLDMLRNIIQHRIQSYNDWCICFADIADQFVNHDSFSSWLLNTIFPSQMV